MTGAAGMRDRVIVAGAGPVGLTLALALAGAGVPVLVLEKREGLNTASRASTFHPPTLEILHRLGVLEQVRAQGHIADRIQYRTPGGVFAEFDLGLLAPDTPFPFRLHLEQSRVTPVMLDRLRRFPHASVRFGAEVTGLRQEGEGGIAAILADGGEERGAWLVGADGGRSAVRAAMGLGFDLVPYPHRILRVMTHAELDPLLPGLAPVTYLHNGARSVSFLRMPDLWRIILRVPPEVADADALDEAWILARLREALPACTRLPPVASRDVYAVARGVVETCRSGRALLAGDAAHLTNTRGGMNMNCGIHDGFALAQALAQASASGDPAPVAAMAAARHRVAVDQLIPRTDRNVAGGPAWLETIRETAARPEAARAYLRGSAMLDMLSHDAEGAIPHG